MIACEPIWSISSGLSPLKNGCALRNFRLSTRPLSSACAGMAYCSYILSRIVTHYGSIGPMPSHQDVGEISIAGQTAQRARASLSESDQVALFLEFLRWNQ